MTIKDMESKEVEVDVMAEDYNNPTLNNYDEGPGQELSNQFALPNKTDRKQCGVFLACVSPVLNNNGVKNLCNKYGQVKGADTINTRHDNYRNVVVMFANLADAENAIYNINKLRFTVNGKVMRASFKRSNEKLNKEPLQFKTIETNNKFYLPMSTPSPLPPPLVRDFDDERMKIYLDSDRTFPNIVNGCATYRHSPESMAKMQEDVSFDEETQQFVHNGSLDFTAPEQCKNCCSPTIKFCKRCKEPFCSMYCLKEYNRNECGCSCVRSETAEVNVKKVNRTAAGRGAKLLSPRVISPTSRSVSSPDSDTKSIGSIGTGQKRIFFREQNEQNRKPFDLPKNNKLVTITNVVNHKIVFLRSFERNDNDQYLKYLNDVVEYAKTAPPLDEMPKKGDVVLAEYEGYYHRVSVHRIENNEATVAFLELGNVEIKPIDGLKKLSRQLKNAKPFVFKASLSGQDVSLKSDKCLIYLYELLEKSTPLKFVAKDIGSGDVQCELTISATNESVNGKLRALNNIKAGQPVMQQDIPIRPFDATAKEVVVIDNSLIAVEGLDRLVTVVTPQHASDMWYIHHRIQEYCKDEYESPYTPRLDEVCLAKCDDGQWYRAIMEQSFGDMLPVMFLIDFCMYNKVHVNNMRRMPMEFRYPQYSVMAEIGGLTDETEVDKLPEKFPLMSKVSVAKIEYLNVNPEELKFFFDIPGLAGGGVAAGSSVVRPKRQQQLYRLVQKVLSEQNEDQKSE